MPLLLTFRKGVCIIHINTIIAYSSAGMLNQLCGRKVLKSLLKPFPKLYEIGHFFTTSNSRYGCDKIFRDILKNLHLSAYPQLMYAFVYVSNLERKAVSAVVLRDG